MKSGLIEMYETQNSIYEVDIRLAMYRRMPKGTAQPVTSHRLVYGEWHPMKEFAVVDDPYGSGGKVLHIHRIDSTVGIFTSPLIGQVFAP